MKLSRSPLTFVSCAAAAVLVLGSAAVRAQHSIPTRPPAGVRSVNPICVDTLRDSAHPAACLEASSVPALGKLVTMSEQLNVNPISGFVGIGTTVPFRPLEVVGAMSCANSPGSIRGVVRPSTNGLFGVMETVAISLDSEAITTNLVSSVSIDREAGAIATIKDGGTFLVTLSTPANNTSAGYVSVRNANVEVAGINGGTGVVFGSSKSFVQPHPTDAGLEIQYVSLEGPEHGVYFRGTARLVDGRARLAVPESFRLVARADGLTVSVTPLGESRGLYVAQKTLDGIEVRENAGGSGAVEFDFLVMGERSALPRHVAVRPNVHFVPEAGATIAEGELPGSYRELMIRNGTLDADGRVDEANARARGWRGERGAATDERECAPIARD